MLETLVRMIIQVLEEHRKVYGPVTSISLGFNINMRMIIQVLEEHRKVYGPVTSISLGFNTNMVCIHDAKVILPPVKSALFGSSKC